MQNQNLSPSPQHFARNEESPPWKSIESIIEKKIHESEGENIEKEVLESSSSLETARKSKYPLCGGFKKKKCLPAGYPQASFPEANMRINYEPCSNSRTEGCKGGEGKIGHPYYSRTITTLSLSHSVSPRLVLPSLPLLSQTRFLSLSLFLSFFFISHSRLCLTSVAEFFRSTAIITPRRWKRKTGVENSCGARGWLRPLQGERNDSRKSFGNSSIIRSAEHFMRSSGAFFLLSLKGSFR